ncbi:MAG TPA: GLPGLI family protein [Pelobium sp.]|nr:GLPGLI family protein [Pelobium sp.]
MIKFVLSAVIYGLLFYSPVVAQQQKFVQQGEIEYEKKANVFALIKSSINKDNEVYMQKYYEQYKTSQPQFVTTKSTLTFSKEQSLFKAAEEDGNPAQTRITMMPGVAQINVVHHNFASGNSTIQKTVFEEVFLLKDSTRYIKWKITDETRTIAGYHCRRANAIVMDSIYVVAFYSDQIAVSSGPESFTGLPGMILGVALPHDHISWFATKVTDQTVDPKSLQAPEKGKSVNQKTLKETLQKAFKQWGQQANAYFKFFTL